MNLVQVRVKLTQTPNRIIAAELCKFHKADLLHFDVELLILIFFQAIHGQIQMGSEGEGGA